MTSIPAVVDLDWVTEHRDEVLLADVRWHLDGPSGLDAYRAGHLPGAVFVDLDRWLADPPSPSRGRHPLPSPERFAEGMSELGIGDADTVVGYDDAGGVFAARLVYLLRTLGHPAALLDGGIGAYDGTLEVGEVRRPRASFTPAPWPLSQQVTMDEVDPSTQIVLDARPAERYRGEGDDPDPRSGHIPGARSLPCRENLDAAGRLLPREVLRQRFAAVGVGAGGGAPVVSYCGSGVTACHNLLVMEWLGLGAGRLYPGSWSQWSSDSSRPVATGEA